MPSFNNKDIHYYFFFMNKRGREPSWQVARGVRMNMMRSTLFPKPPKSLLLVL